MSTEVGASCRYLNIMPNRNAFEKYLYMCSISHFIGPVLFSKLCRCLFTSEG